MKNLKKQKSFQVFVLFLAILLSGCAGSVKHMSSVPANKIVTSPEKGKAMVVFMRPSKMGFAIQSSVFEIIEDQPTIVGIVAAKKKVAYQVEPGKHLFMVVGESADFMSADLEANKVYYALVTPRMGAWKARFSLEPIHTVGDNDSNYQKSLDACEWVEISPATSEWANDNMPSLKSKYENYHKKWMSKPEADRPKLLPEDGKMSN